MIDSFGRKIEYMRVSVTDRCNLRCGYCMPKGIKNIPMSEILTFEEIERACEAAADLGIKYIRLTGGEPLVRLGIEKLVAMIRSIKKIESITMTTNGILLKEKLPELVKAGLDGVNVSLDTLDADKYKNITGFDMLDKALGGIDAALEAGIKVKINTVVLKENIDDCFDIIKMAEKLPIDVRFIEMMPIGEGKNFDSISCETIFDKIFSEYEGVVRDGRHIGAGPAKYYHIPGFVGSIGFINAVHGAFCDECNRVRLTSEGFLKACLCYGDGESIREMLRNGEPEELKRVFERVIKNKPRKHCFDQRQNITEGHDMSEIGG